ncbi:MAG TPA: glycoside hydrolase family 15 protein [Gemmatimonadaceae bacterium]|nr:glycoside hydrolase family 15 protein [Gemmatimonadaceae bacterium]
MRRIARVDGYAAIADYGVIGNLRSAALVAMDGAIDWCCLPELDSPSVLGALLDAGRGGRFVVRPTGAFEAEQEYVPDTNVLVTRFRTGSGQVTVTDFMPLRGSIIGCEDPDTRAEIHRLVQGDGGAVEIELEWSPRFGYAAEPTEVTTSDDGFVASQGQECAALGGVPGRVAVQSGTLGGMVRGRFVMQQGERVALVMRYGSRDARHGLDEGSRALDQTIATWRDWVAVETSDRSWAGACVPAVIRSELVLKLLTHPTTGAIAAAATTSLPETIGGVRNWDYRFSWIRDSAFTVQALMAVGHRAEALDFLAWAERAAMSRDDRWGLQIMYGLRGETDLPERELTHLSGYRNSRPVRVGNAAARQRQHDIYGELMGAAHQFVLSGGVLEPDLLSFLSRVADQASVAWPTPDEGIWEVRREPRHYVYSKVMAWVALDRAIRLTMRTGMRGNVARWTRERDTVHAHVLAHGYDQELGAFVQAYGSRALDAANLLIPVMEFLPPDDPRVRRTIDLTLERLTDRGMVYRYLTDDGLPGSEGAFGLCTFWLVDALALSGRVDEARELFEGMVRRANHLGLYAEEIDPRSGAFLGNYPQAFTHIGLINSVLYLARAEGRRPRRGAEPIGAATETPAAGVRTMTADG